ncbi:hypothetical protein J1N35_036967 [Gossypium stocksii]|uniref:Uncharacterized protein n=1 Tax=Gossypium stocksii TaxID=47602 RepID=A0A9D3UJA5_9ROSI|nr:hypothetical protein J1N35_036967 [Gossypium stocksii]
MAVDLETSFPTIIFAEGILVFPSHKVLRRHFCGDTFLSAGIDYALANSLYKGWDMLASQFPSPPFCIPIVALLFYSQVVCYSLHLSNEYVVPSPLLHSILWLLLVLKNVGFQFPVVLTFIHSAMAKVAVTPSIVLAEFLWYKKKVTFSKGNRFVSPSVNIETVYCYIGYYRCPSG